MANKQASTKHAGPPLTFNAASYLTPLQQGPRHFQHSVMDPLMRAGETNENLDIKEFFPETSTFSDDQAGRIESILEALIKEGVYGSDRRWKLPEGRMTSEEKWAQIFDRVLDYASLRHHAEWHRMRTQSTWVAHDKTMIDGLRKPDVILVPRQCQLKQDGVPFGAVLTYTEVKETNNTRNVDLAVRQLRDVAGFAIACQVNRDYFIGSVLAGRSLTIVLCARDVTYRSTPINIDDSPETFIQAIIALSAGYAESLGFETDTLFTVDHGNNSCMVELDGYRLTITRRIFLRSITLTGRGTRVLLCRDERNKPFVLKDSWVPAGDSDEVFVHDIFRKCQPNPLDPGTADIFGPKDRYRIFCDCWSVANVGWSVANRLPGIPIISYAGYATQTTQLIRDRFSANNLRFSKRNHIRVLMETCGVPIMWFSSRREFLNAMMCVVIAHFNGERHDVLHCDISDANVWLSVEDPEDEDCVILPWSEEKPNEFPKHAAILGDWGKATYYGPSATGSDDSDSDGIIEPGGITGSYPFISAEMASPAGVEGRIPYRTSHDLESLFWVMWIVSVNTTGPYNSRRRWSDKPDPTTSFFGSTRKAIDANADDLEAPAWATPGIHQVSLAEIQSFKSSIPQRQFLGAMAPYWKDGQSGQIFQTGMRQLREHFEWTEVYDRKFRPPHTITHETFIHILKYMHDNIPPEEDRQTMASVHEARERYRRMMADTSQDMYTGLLNQSSTAIRPSTSDSKRKAAKEAPGALDGSKRTRVGGGQAWGQLDSTRDAQDEEGRGAGEASASTSHPEVTTSESSRRKSKFPNFFTYPSENSRLDSRRRQYMSSLSLFPRG